jgi:hypothetical protein
MENYLSCIKLIEPVLGHRYPILYLGRSSSCWLALHIAFCTKCIPFQPYLMIQSDVQMCAQMCDGAAGDMLRLDGPEVVSHQNRPDIEEWDIGLLRIMLQPNMLVWMANRT